MGRNPILDSLKASQYFSLVSGGGELGWAVWPLNRAALVRFVRAVADLANLERVVAGISSGGAPIMTCRENINDK